MTKTTTNTNTSPENNTNDRAPADRTPAGRAPRHRNPNARVDAWRIEALRRTPLIFVATVTPGNEPTVRIVHGADLLWKVDRSGAVVPVGRDTFALPEVERASVIDGMFYFGVPFQDSYEKVALDLRPETMVEAARDAKTVPPARHREVIAKWTADYVRSATARLQRNRVRAARRAAREAPPVRDAAPPALSGGVVPPAVVPPALAAVRAPPALAAHAPPPALAEPAGDVPAPPAPSPAPEPKPRKDVKPWEDPDLLAEYAAEAEALGAPKTGP